MPTEPPHLQGQIRLHPWPGQDAVLALLRSRRAHRRLLPAFGQRLCGDDRQHQSGEPGRGLQRLGVQRDVQLDRPRDLRQARRQRRDRRRIRSRRSTSAPASPITSARSIAWDRGCTLGANGQCFGAGPIPFSSVNPTPYPSGFNAGTLGIPGLLIPIAGDPQTITERHQRHPGRRARPDFGDRPAAERILARRVQGEGARHRRLCARPSRRRGLARQFRRPRRGHARERVRQRAVSCIPDGAGTTPDVTHLGLSATSSIDDVRHNYTDVLPSANLTFDLRRKLLLRLAAAETMSRPGLQRARRHGVAHRHQLHRQRRQPQPEADQGHGLRCGARILLRAVVARSRSASSTTTCILRDLRHVDRAPISPSSTTAFHQYHDLVAGSTRPASWPASSCRCSSRSAMASASRPTAPTSTAATRAERRWSAPRNTPTTWSATTRTAGSARGWPTPIARHYFVGLDRSSAENQDNYGQLDGSVSFNVTKNVALTARRAQHHQREAEILRQSPRTSRGRSIPTARRSSSAPGRSSRAHSRSAPPTAPAPAARARVRPR